MRPRALLLFAVAGLLAFGACGSKEPARTTLGAGGATLEAVEVTGDLTHLVPADTDVLVYMPDLESALKDVRSIVGLFNPEAAEEMDLDKSLEEIPIGDLMETDEPMALALKLPVEGGGDPLMTLIAAVTDVEKAKERAKGAKMPELASSGRYVAMLLAPEGEVTPAGTAPAIAKDLPDGDVVVRADLAGIRTRFADQIDEAFREMDRNLPDAEETGGMDLSAFVGALKKSAKTLLDAAERIDLVADVDGTSVNVRFLFVAKPGSALDGVPASGGDLGAVTARLPEGFPIAALATGNPHEVPEWMEPLMEAAFALYPEDFRAFIEKQMKDAERLQVHMGEEHGFALDIGADGFSMVGLNAAKDAEAYFREWEALDDEETMAMLARMGIEVEMLPTTKVAGADVRHMQMSIDFEKLMSNFPTAGEMPPEIGTAADAAMQKLFGPEGIVIHLAPVDGWVVTVMGDDAFLAKTIEEVRAGTGGGRQELDAALAATGGRPSFLLRLDARGLGRGMLDFVRELMAEEPEKAREIPEIRDGSPIPLVLYGAAEGRHYLFGLTLDLQPVKELVDELSD